MAVLPKAAFGLRQKAPTKKPLSGTGPKAAFRFAKHWDSDAWNERRQRQRLLHLLVHVGEEAL
jgi:hypothetical protein